MAAVARELGDIYPGEIVTVEAGNKVASTVSTPARFNIYGCIYGIDIGSLTRVVEGLAHSQIDSHNKQGRRGS